MQTNEVQAIYAATVESMEFHEVANIFPLMDGEQFRDLCTDIASNGLIEPIWVWQGKIIDGRNRYRACVELGLPTECREYRGTEEGLLPFVLALNLKRRHLTASQRAAVAVDVEAMLAKQAKERQIRKPVNSVFQLFEKQNEPIHAAKQAAHMLNTNTQYVVDAKKIKEQEPRVFEQVLAGNLTLKEAKKEIRTQEKKEQHAKLTKLAETVPASDRWNIFQGDISKVRLEPGSIDAIITDPPYPKDCLPLWGELAKFAKHHLKPGGVLLAMTGNLYIPDILAMLGEHLTYQWQLACTLPGQHSEVHAAWVNNQMWKPILVYRNGGDLVNIGSDLFQNEGKDKAFHVWGQGVDGYRWQIEHFTKPNDLICDPFLGGGTTAVAALQLKRRFVGFDVEPEKVAISKGRLAELREE
jgi:ParB-like chromosome segregation protein Spo0J